MNNITLSNATRSIELSKKFAAAAAKYGTEEYRMLQEVRRDYPGFKVVDVARKASKNARNTYKGLTYEYMEKYIAGHDDEEKSIMLEYMMLRGESEEAEDAFAESASYQEIKDWFLDTFPAVVEYHEKRAAALEKTRKNKEEKRTALAQKQKEDQRAALLKGAA